MSETLPASLQQKIEERLRYYEDLGIRLFYRDRVATEGAPRAVPAVAKEPPRTAIGEYRSLPKRKSEVPAKSATHLEPIIALSGNSLFEAVDRVPDDTLLKIRDDIGPDCRRCKLHKGRNKIVFGDGSPTAKLVFVGEGPGADEDAQGLPFVGRAGKLLTQMIEAMGLQRKDVYICNVVKCRPPENRAPEPDEVASCSPYLLRQVDTINPQVIVCLGAVAAKTLLNTTRGISSFRGEWLEWRGRKLMATYHPAYLLRNPPAKADVWKDLQKVMAELGLQLPKKKSS
jgi:uracil-DNA glycosylase